MPDTQLAGRPVELEEMLAAREARVERQQAFLRQHGCALISYSMNIAGPRKRFPLAERAFAVGKNEIEDVLRRRGWKPLAGEASAADTGLEQLWAVDVPPLELKRALIPIEDTHPLGRLLDIDILTPGGEKVSRVEIGRPERCCLVCGKPGAGCARERAHSLEELFRRTVEMMEDFFAAEYADEAAACAVRALLHEVCVTPKPGLVDRANNGAHKDMDLFTFVDSTAALIPYFREITLLGLRRRDLPAGELLPLLRHPGQRAEERMRRATGGVNTHKGAIFSLGILCAALGRVYQTEGERDPAAILDLCGQIAAPALESDLGKAPDNQAATHGEALYREHRITGIRGEAAAGFPSVKGIGLPALERSLLQGAPLNDAAVATLLHLMANVEDTNIISRSSLRRQRELQEEIRLLLERHRDLPDLVEAAGVLDRQMIRENISPGGCADLLALSLLLLFWTGSAAG